MAENIPKVVVPPPPARNPIDQFLAWIEFSTEGNHNIIWNEDRVEAFENFIGLNESDIRDTAFSFSKSTTAQGRINFGLRRVKYTLGNMH